MFILSNLATTLDGKIAPASRALFPLGSKADLKEMLRLRQGVDAVLIGASTLRSYRKPNRAGKGKEAPLNVVLSSSLKGISPDWPFFQAEGLRRLLLVTERIPASRAARFEGSETVVLARKYGLARSIMAELAKRGVRRLLIEGGGEVMWHFAEHNLIDEYHVTLTPRILGGRTAPTLVDGQGFSAPNSLKLKLKSLRRIGDELYLTYLRT